MKSIKPILVTLLVLSLILQFTVVFASSENWVEVIRFTGETEDITTEVFTCDNVEWRIRWSYSRRADGPTFLQFRFYIYESEEMIIEEDLIEYLFPEDETSGTLYLNQSGSFYLNIHNDGFNYNVVVEQNTYSIPEFPSWTLIALFVTASFAMILIRNKISKRGI